MKNKQTNQIITLPWVQSHSMEPCYFWVWIGPIKVWGMWPPYVPNYMLLLNFKRVVNVHSLPKFGIQTLKRYKSKPLPNPVNFFIIFVSWEIFSWKNLDNNFALTKLSCKHLGSFRGKRICFILALQWQLFHSGMLSAFNLIS